MRATSIDKTLEEKVTELEEKSDRIDQSKRTEERVESASENIRRINRRLNDVVASAEELRFYVRLYGGAFGDGDRPGGIQPKIRSALDKVEISDEELLEAAQDKRLSELEDQVEEAEEQIKDAIKLATDELKSEQENWLADLNAAEELNSIVGSDRDFRDHIEKMRTFLTRVMWDNNSRTPSGLTAKWERYERKWEEHAGKHGWDTFQEDHNLDDRTVEELQQFTDGDPVPLSELSLSTLKEIKQEPELNELESALQLEVRS